MTLQFADQKTVDALNAEVVALLKTGNYNGKEAIDFVLRQRCMHCIVPAKDDERVELWCLPPPDGRYVTVWWESGYGQAIAVTTPEEWESAAVGFDNQEMLWEEILEQMANDEMFRTRARSRRR